MITSETRPGSIPARSSAALMATAPSSCAGVVANAPLKLPTAVRAALTMTTSSDMDVSWVEVLGARGLQWRAPDWQATLPRYPVNGVEACQPAGGRNLAAAHSK